MYDADRYDAEILLERSLVSPPYTILVLADLLKAARTTIVYAMNNGKIPQPAIIGRTVNRSTADEWTHEQVIDILMSGWAPLGHAPIKHGTPAGYSMHLRRRVPVCDPCREAKNVYQNTKRKAKVAA